MAHTGDMGPLAAALRARREKLDNMTQAKAAEIMGTSSANVARWEGRVAPSPEWYDEIARFLGYADAEDGNFALLLMRNTMWLKGVPIDTTPLAPPIDGGQASPPADLDGRK